MDHVHQLPSAAPWSLAAGAAGQVLVALGVVLGLASSVLASLRRERPASWAFLGSVAAVLLAFAALTALFVADQFCYRYVFAHGAADHELRYKVAGVWSGQEGSFLLWACCSGVLGALALRAVGGLRQGYLVVFGLLQAGLCGILAYESPFALLPPVDGRQVLPPTGQGMAPTLLNYWVTIHPPTIFLGFGSLGVLFAWSAAAAWSGRFSEWAAPARPWALVSLTLLGVGLSMGGFWAYETLGWGGFWAWDPVENTSLVPWCAVAALVHGLYVQVARNRLHLSTAWLGGMPFLLFGYGTFLTRSGFLGDTSVHSFASMERSALFILVGLVSLAAVGFHVALLRGRRQLPAAMVEPRGPRERMLALGQLLLAFTAAFSAVGMSVPLLQSLSGQAPKVVEERVYNTVLAWFFVPLLVLFTVAPWVSWRKLDRAAFLGRLSNVSAVTIGLVGTTLLFLKGWGGGFPAEPGAVSTVLLRWTVPQVPFVVSLLGVCYFACVGNLWRLVEIWWKTKRPVGGLVTHLGLALALTGLVFSRALEQRALMSVAPTSPAQAFGMAWSAGPPTKSFVDRSNVVPIVAVGPDRPLEFRPGFYYLSPGEDGEPRPVSWPAVVSRGLYDLYLVVGDMFFEATEPTLMEPGAERALQSAGMLVKYNGLDVQGEAGTASAVFGARLTVSFLDGRKFEVKPTFGVGSGPKAAPVDDDYSVRLDRIDAGSKSAAITVLYRRPAYAVEVFYKPMTVLVWWGVGIMGLGGLIAAWQRRAPRPSKRKAAAAAAQDEAQATS
jgi:cytochrome c-type biogenesis protein CcmF